jgi:hypothetical protein
MVQEVTRDRMDNIKYLDVPATAQRFGLSEETIRRYIRTGRVRALKAGRRWAVELASVREHFSDDPEIRDFLDSHMPQTAEATS